VKVNHQLSFSLEMTDVDEVPEDGAGRSWFAHGKLVLASHGYYETTVFEVTGCTRSGLPLVRRRRLRVVAHSDSPLHSESEYVLRDDDDDAGDERFTSAACSVRFGKQHSWSVLVPRGDGRERYHMICAYKPGDILKNASYY
jgi:hypothetical protein